MRALNIAKLNPFAPTPVTGDVRLTRRFIYILPTREGLYFGATLLVMLVAAINYSNGLAYALTFLLGSIGIVAILQTHRNLSGLTLRAGSARPVFAGEAAVFRVALGNDAALVRYAIDVGFDLQLRRSDLLAKETVVLDLLVPTVNRGYIDAPPIKVRTRFPLGLWRAWSRPFALPMRCLVYPTPAAPQPLPVLPDEEGEEQPGRGTEGDDFRGLRDFHVGDPMQRIAWKKVAAGQGWYTKQFGSGAGKTIWLDWNTLPALAEEDRLGLLCRWILMADQQGLPYGLRLPHIVFDPSTGENHRDRCLEALALFPTSH